MGNQRLAGLESHAQYGVAWVLLVRASVTCSTRLAPLNVFLIGAAAAADGTAGPGARAAAVAGSGAQAAGTIAGPLAGAGAAAAAAAGAGAEAGVG